MMTKIETSVFDYALPKQLIAHKPAPDRNHARLMILRSSDQTLAHDRFSNLRSWLEPGDVLVLNDTKVIPARLFARRATGGIIEIFLLRQIRPGQWKALIKNVARLKTGERLRIGPNLTCILEARHEPQGEHLLAFHADDGHDPEALIANEGKVPLPPYISPEANAVDYADRYQTVFAKNPGAVAAPTAGLHFTDAQLVQLKSEGFPVLYITLHVGYGTFQPIQTDCIQDHRLHTEESRISDATAQALNQYLSEGRRIIAVGTTVTRTLEAAFSGGRVCPGTRQTDLFIYPGYQFSVVKGLITNFHLPRTSLLCLVAALCGNKMLRIAYQSAIENHYRFYSFGDAMLVLP